MPGFACLRVLLSSLSLAIGDVIPMPASLPDMSPGSAAAAGAASTDTTVTSTAAPTQAPLEDDVLNAHPSMTAVLRAVDKAAAGVFGADGLKRLSAELVAKARRDDCPLNVRLFLARVVINRADVFHPHAADWLEPLMYLALRSDAFGDGLHVFLRELCIALLSWAGDVKPRADQAKLVGQFIAHLMGRCEHKRPSIVRQNLELVKLFVERWSKTLVPRREPIYDLLMRERSNERVVGIQLLGILVANDFSAFDPTDSSSLMSERQFYDRLVRFHWLPVFRRI